jgi:hypothetical protein
MSVCARNDCDKIGKNACSACLKEFYCSGQCQKQDWKAHMIMCTLVKLMPDVMVSFRNVSCVVVKVMSLTEAQIYKLGHKKHIKVLERAAAFAQKQFGKRIPRKAVYERNNRDRIIDRADAWDVDILILCQLNNKLDEVITSCNDGNDLRECWTKRISHLQILVTILESWIVQIGLSEGERILDEEKIDRLFRLRLQTEHSLSMTYEKLNDNDKVDIVASRLSIMQSR